MDKTMICSLSSYRSKFLMMAIAISSLPSPSHADLRQQVNMEKMREQSSEQCKERIKREALFGSDIEGFTKIVGNTIYSARISSWEPACSLKWTKRAEIGVERIYNSDGAGYPEYIPLKEVWHIERADICRYYNEFGYSTITVRCYDLKTGNSYLRR